MVRLCLFYLPISPNRFCFSPSNFSRSAPCIPWGNCSYCFRNLRRLFNQFCFGKDV